METEINSNVDRDCEAFYASLSEPAKIGDIMDSVGDFMKRAQCKDGGRIALVTSGSPQVQLEEKSVRHLKFGEKITGVQVFAEHLITRGYTVIYLHDGEDLHPFNLSGNDSEKHYLDAFDIICDDENEDKNVLLKVKECFQDKLKILIDLLERDDPRLLCIEYTTISEYFYFLKTILIMLKSLETSILLFVGCNAPEYYIPKVNIFNHKIPSSQGSVSISLNMVPSEFSQFLIKKCAPSTCFITLVRSKLSSETSYQIFTPSNTSHPLNDLIYKSGYVQTIENIVDNMKSYHDSWILSKCTSNT